MAIDTRAGRKDYNVRYKVYAPDTDISDSLNIDKYCRGLLHCKDVTPYSNTAKYISNKWQMENVDATIETMDRTDIGVDWLVRCLADGLWYIVVSVSSNSHNETQYFSARPVVTTQIAIRRAN